MSSDFRLVDSGWGSVMDEALQLGHPKLRIVCPFIKRRVAERLITVGNPRDIQVITRFNLLDFYNGVSDTEALRLLLAKGAQIRGVRNLHSKVYLFGDRRAIVTSANLTDAALQRNHEFGFVSDELGIISCCADYFDSLWSKAGANLTSQRVETWAQKVSEHLAKGSRPSNMAGLGDEGVDVGTTVPPFEQQPWVAEAHQGFVKFFGISKDRADHSLPVLHEVKRAGCHWACTYPKGKRPRQVEDGALMFMARLVKEPRDIVIFGRAVAMAHDKRRDNATDEDKKLRPFKEQWPNYIRVHHSEFVAGSMKNGISLNALMESLGENGFASTQANAAREEGNTDPRSSYKRQPHVRLSAQGMDWLNARLEEAFFKHGRLTSAELENLDWP